MQLQTSIAQRTQSARCCLDRLDHDHVAHAIECARFAAAANKIVYYSITAVLGVFWLFCKLPIARLSECTADRWKRNFDESVPVAGYGATLLQNGSLYFKMDLYIWLAERAESVGPRHTCQPHNKSTNTSYQYLLYGWKWPVVVITGAAAPLLPSECHSVLKI